MQNKELATFDFNGNTLNVVEDDNGMPWFIAKEVSDILEYKDTEAMTRRLDDDEKLNLQIVGAGQNREMITINESGLYSAILGSKKPQAKAFKKWVTSEVLPSIRKTGGFGQQDTETRLSNIEKVLDYLASSHLKAIGLEPYGTMYLEQDYIKMPTPEESALRYVRDYPGIKTMRTAISALSRSLPFEIMTKDKGFNRSQEIRNAVYALERNKLIYIRDDCFIELTR